MKQFWPEGWLIDTPGNQAALSSPLCLADAQARGIVLEARAAVCDASHNLIVDLGCMRGVIPRAEGAVGIADGTVRDIALISRVGKPVCFLVTGIGTGADGEPVATLSRRAAQELCLRAMVARLRPGDVLDTRVTHLEPFGAFCDIGCGLASLLPIDAISVSRISHPRDRFCAGDDIRAVVAGVEGVRVTLTHKELLGTWGQNAARFTPGETVSGIVRSVEEYGIFVELTPNLAGLAEPHRDVCAGQQASVYVKSILPEKMKVKLILIDSFERQGPPEPLAYFLSGDYIPYWRYSPENCARVIESRFD